MDFGSHHPNGRITNLRNGEACETVRRSNLSPFLDDPDVWLVSSIESYDEDTDTARMGPIFSERVIHPPAEPVITSATAALAVTGPCSRARS